MRSIRKIIVIIAVILLNSPLFSQIVADFSPLDTTGCPPSLVVNFKNKSTGPAPLTYLWDFGDGRTSDKRDPEITFMQPRSYLIKLTVTSGTLVASKTTTLRVFIPPVANFTAPATKGCTPYIVNFADNSVKGDANITKWYWSFMDGTTSALQNPSYTYNTQGVHAVFLRVTDANGCINSIEKKDFIDVAYKPTVNFSANPATSCKTPTVVQFTNTSSGKDTLTYLWDFGNGAPTSTTKNPFASYSNFGSYKVKLTATLKNYGCSNYVERTAVIINEIKAVGTLKQNSVPILNNGFVCTGEIDFSSQSIGGANVLWDFGDNSGLIAQDFGKHTYNNSGTYSVKLITSPFNSCADTAKWTINVEKVTSNFTFSPASSCVSPVNVQFSNTSTNAVSYVWRFHDNSTSTQTDPSFQYARKPDKDQYVVHQPELYEVVLEATSLHNCKSIAIKTFQFNLPTSLFSVNKADGCVPLTVTFADKSQPMANIIKSKWFFGDNTIDSTTTKTIQHTYNQPGIYNVKLVAFDNIGCKDTSYVIQIKAGKKPEANFSVTTPVSFYTSDPVQLNDLTPASDLPDYWHYSIGGVNVTSCPNVQNPSFKYNFDVGPLPVKLTVGYNGCYDDTIKNDLIQSTGPVGSFSYDINCSQPLTYYFTGITKGADSYLWNFGDLSTDNTSLTPSHAYNDPGDYVVKLITTKDGRRDTVQQLIKVRQPAALFTTKTNACVNTPVKFVGLTSHPVYTSKRDKYIWDFGDSTPLIQTNRDSLTHKFTNRGLYNIKLKAIYENGCYDSITKQIRIMAPYAHINPDKTKGCLPLRITFSDTSKADLNPLTKWEWIEYPSPTAFQSFLTPGNSFLRQFNLKGDFKVILRVTDNLGCIGNDTVIIGVASPNATFNFNYPRPPKPSQICAGDTISLTRFDNDIDSLEWDFGDGTQSNLKKTYTNYQYNEMGQFKVTLKIYKHGCLASDTTDTRVVVEKADAHFSVSNSDFNCYPASVDFNHDTTIMSHVTSGVWEFGYNGSTGTYSPTKTFVYPDTGHFKVMLKVFTPLGCTSTFTDTISVSGPVGSFVISPKSACKGDTVTFTMQNDTVGVVNWFWDFGEGSFISGNPVKKRFFSTGSKEIILRLVGKDPTCQPTRGGFLLVEEVNAKIAVMDTSTCEGYEVKFVNVSIGNTSFKWDLGNKESYDSVSINKYLPGLYNIKLFVDNSLNQCKDTAKMALLVNPSPPIVLSNNDTVICRGDSILLNVSGGNTVAWWPNKWIADSSVYTSYSKPDSTIKYYVKTIFPSSGCYSLDSVTTTVQQKPVLNLTATPNTSVVLGAIVTLNAETGENVTYKWAPITGLSCDNCPNPTFEASDTIMYGVEIEDLYKCFKIKDSITVNVEVKYPKTFLPTAFNPASENPGDRILRIRGTAITEVVEFKIFNRWGNLIYEAYNFDKNDESKGWDGKFKGKEQPMDSYVYIVKIRTARGKEISQKGVVLLIR